MQLQTEALMEAKSKMMAEKEALERNHNEVLANLELLEKIYNTSDHQLSSEGDSDSGLRRNPSEYLQRRSDALPNL